MTISDSNYIYDLIWRLYIVRDITNYAFYVLYMRFLNIKDFSPTNKRRLHILNSTFQYVVFMVSLGAVSPSRRCWSNPDCDGWASVAIFSISPFSTNTKLIVYSVELLERCATPKCSQ